MTTKRFDPRELMELAVDVMNQSTLEPRDDGKASPLVGAVLWNRGTTQAASRSELRDGDHAEYTLLERKNRDARLDDAVLFTTLEPCAPGSRRDPKLSCAERIVLARIKDVWVGIEDPDPTVDRKGIKYLQDRGVKVHLFDRDLQERIRETNRDFIGQAEERAAAARDGRGKLPSALSEFEVALRGAAISDLERRALEEYRAAVGKTNARDLPSLYRRLSQQGLLAEQKGKLVPTGFGTCSSARNLASSFRRQGCSEQSTTTTARKSRATSKVPRSTSQGRPSSG
ncbi:MAG: hypothetical protein QM765_18455 [Myxococcales bacterium]